MKINHCHIVDIDAPCQSVEDAQCAVTPWRGTADMVAVVADGPIHYLPLWSDGRAMTRQDDGSGSFAKVKTQTLDVKWSALIL